MKIFYYLVAICFLSIKVVIAQAVALNTLTNFNVNTSTNEFSFDIYSQSTGLDDITVGLTSYYIDYNNAALNTPILSNVNPKYTAGSPSGVYNSMTIGLSSTTPKKVVVTIRWNGAGAGGILSTVGPIGERICTVTLTISNPIATSGISWDLINSALTSSNFFQLVDNNFQGSSNIPLPVELSSFTGKVVNGTKVDLKWGTKTEVNNYGFNVERRVKDGEWEKIGFVEGHGNSNSPKEYGFVDNDLFAGGSNFQYRLKQVDNDGQFEYSDVVEVTVVPAQYELSQNYPNPFNPSTTIRFSLPAETRLKINIYNMLGELVETLAEGNFEAGYHKVMFNASSLPSGAYIYRIESSEFTQVRKMILIK